MILLFSANNVSVSPVVVCIWENLHTSRAKVFTLRPHEYSFYGTEIILYYFLWKVSNEKWSKYFSNNISSHHRASLPSTIWVWLPCPHRKNPKQKKWNWIHVFFVNRGMCWITICYIRWTYRQKHNVQFQWNRRTKCWADMYPLKWNCTKKLQWHPRI